MKLKEIPKINTGFNTPDTYFESLNQKMIQNIFETKKPKLNLKYLWMAVSGMAAALVIFFVINNNQTTIDDLTAQQIMINNTVYNDYFMAENLSDEDLEALAESLEVADMYIFFNQLDNTTE